MIIIWHIDLIGRVWLESVFFFKDGEIDLKLLGSALAPESEVFEVQSKNIFKFWNVEMAFMLCTLARWTVRISEIFNKQDASCIHIDVTVAILTKEQMNE